MFVAFISVVNKIVDKQKEFKRFLDVRYSEASLKNKTETTPERMETYIILCDLRFLRHFDLIQEEMLLTI